MSILLGRQVNNYHHPLQAKQPDKTENVSRNAFFSVCMELEAEAPLLSPKDLDVDLALGCNY